MLRLTDILGRPVVGDDGALGPVRDLSIRLSGQAVEAVVVGDPAAPTLVEWAAVAPAGPDDILEPRAHGGSALQLLGALPPARELFDDELLLGRDVLDTQIVDVVGHRVDRVGDVLLEPRDGLLLPVGVEVGPASLVRRLGLRRSADRLAEHVVAWTDLHLTSARGHQVQLGTSAAALHRLDARELAELVARLPPTHAADVLAAVPPERASQALELSHPHVQRRLRRVRGSRQPAPPRWQRLRGWTRHHRPVPR